MKIIEFFISKSVIKSKREMIELVLMTKIIIVGDQSFAVAEFILFNAA